jgi:hypothetical protein
MELVHTIQIVPCIFGRDQHVGYPDILLALNNFRHNVVVECDNFCQYIMKYRINSQKRKIRSEDIISSCCIYVVGTINLEEVLEVE